MYARELRWVVDTVTLVMLSCWILPARAEGPRERALSSRGGTEVTDSRFQEGPQVAWASDALQRLSPPDTPPRAWDDVWPARADSVVNTAMLDPLESDDTVFDAEDLPAPMREEMRGLVWTKGDFKIVPYGVLWTDVLYSSSRTFPGRFILWIESEERQGESTFQIESRYSRLGVDVQGPTVDLWGGLTGHGNIEIDFLGNFVTENRPDLRLRHAYWEAKNESMRILIGQTWDVISPRLPNTVNFSVGWAAGNIGFRRAQLRLERYYRVSSTTTWTWQGALAQNVIEDFAGEASAGVTRETGNWPMIQGRTAVSFDGFTDEQIVMGVSGHIGDTGFDFAGGHPANPNLGPQDDVRLLTWSCNADLLVPMTSRLGVHGEFFTGSNLSNEFGGIAQGVCPCLRVPIRSIGGWSEIWYHWTPLVRTHIGAGIDDPRNEDFVVGRSYNRFIYANTFVDLTKHVITGLEVSSWRTNYQNRSSDPGFTPVNAPTLPGEAVAIDFTVRFTF